MSFCQQIYNEMQKIEGFKVDLSTLSHGNYDELIEVLPKEIKKLKALTSILKLQEKAVYKIEEVLLNKNIDIATSIFEIIATRENEICDTSIIYVGDLDFQTHQKYNPELTKFPDSLKFIVGKFLAFDSDITDVDFTYVEDFINISVNKNLTEVKILNCNDDISLANNQSLKQVILGTVDNTVNLDCSELEVLRLGNIGSDLFLQDCPKLRIENVYGDNIDHKIDVGRWLVVHNDFAKPMPSNLFEHFKYTLDKSCYPRYVLKRNQILKRFDVKMENIRILGK